jgi:hypothetical protein
LGAGIAAAALAFAPWLTGQAFAACGLTPEAVASAEVVFVGTLSSVSADGTSATFLVEEIWKGGGLVAGEPATIDTTNALQSLSPPPPGAGPSRYLVLASDVGGQLRSGSSCNLFHYPWDASYAAFRPADAPPASDSETDAGGGIPAAVAGVAAAAALLIVVSFISFRRGSPPRE